MFARRFRVDAVGLRGAEVVTKKQILVSEEQLSMRHGGWCPDLSLLSRDLVAIRPAILWLIAGPAGGLGQQQQTSNQWETGFQGLDPIIVS